MLAGSRPRRAERRPHEGVSYADLVGTVQEIAVGERFQIIEALAERIAATILAQQPLIEAISVTVEKPAAAIAALSRRSRSPSTGAALLEPAARPLISRSAPISRTVSRPCARRPGASRRCRKSSLWRARAFYETPPWGKTDQPAFANAALTVRTSLSPRALLETGLEIERAMGRVRLERWGPRRIDIDVLTYGDEHIAEPHLTIPHPAIAERAFVLVPLLEIAPDFVLDGKKGRICSRGSIAVASSPLAISHKKGRDFSRPECVVARLPIRRGAGAQSPTRLPAAKPHRGWP